MSSENVIIMFKDTVSKTEINQRISEIEAAGGKVTKHWDMLNGIAATVPITVLDTFKSVQADKISSIEPDGIVTIQ